MGNMKYKLLGTSGLRVSELCLGTMTFGEEWGWGSSEEISAEILRHFEEQGGNFLDTANYYTQGSSERIIGDAISANREWWVLATKYTLGTRKGDPNSGGNHRKNLVQSIEASLSRLKTSYIDLLWVHAWDFTIRPQELMKSLDDVIKQGKVLHIGISDTPAWVVAQANTIAELKGWSSFVGLQIEYSLIQRTPERDLLPMAKALGLTVTPWSPLGSGVLTGKYANGIPQGVRLKENSLRLTTKNLEIAKVVAEVADQIKHTSSQIALAWILQSQPTAIPIVGARSLPQLQENMGCLSAIIPDELMEKLNGITQIDLGFPHEFLRSDNVRDIIYSGLDASIIR